MVQDDEAISPVNQGSDDTNRIDLVVERVVARRNKTGQRQVRELGISQQCI